MGIYDRDYYRGSRGGFLDSIGSRGQVCKWLIIINVIAFVVQIAVAPFTDWFLLDTRDVLMRGQVWRLLTYAFLHSPGDIFHILFNMLFLFWFGRELEDMYSSREFLWFYLVAALLGGLGFTAFAAYFQVTGNMPMGMTSLKCLGASGAVTAVMLLYACHFPQRTILLFFVLPIPIWLFVGFQVFQDTIWFFHSVQQKNPLTTSTAVAVHLSGALFGFLYYRKGWRISPLLSRLRMPSFGRSRRRPRLRVYHDDDGGSGALHEPVHVGESRSAVDEQLEAKLDAVLEKIQTKGKESLNEEEREILQRASEIYKKRRSSEESYPNGV